MAGFEIEHKYLIEMPNSDMLETLVRIDMVQTYLMSEKGTTARVRMTNTDGAVKYIYTSKKRLTALTCIEDEKEVTEQEYNKLLETEDKTRQPIIKTRYKLPFDSHIFEIDVYPFWQDKAIMEVELSTEDEEVQLPPSIAVIKEVTDDVRYKNFMLARGNIPKGNE